MMLQMRGLLVLLFALLLASLTSAATVYPINPWRQPTAANPWPDLDVVVGDKITFTWGVQTHTVIKTKGDCTVGAGSGAVVLATASPFTYTVQEADVGTITFACSVGTHCSQGQIFNVTVTEAPPSSDPGAQGGSSSASMPAVSVGLGVLAAAMAVAGIVGL